MQATVGIVTQSNNDLKTEVTEQKAYIKSLEEDNAPKDVITTAEVNDQEDTPRRVIMSKDSPEHRCHACDKKFNAASDLDRHMKDKHTEYDCHMCNKKFTSRKHAEDHICMDGDLVPQVCEKSYCKKEFVSSVALKKHMQASHFGNQRSVCPKCGDIADNKWNMKKHMESCGRGVKEGQEKSKEICFHWKRGNCNRGYDCAFSHVGKQDTPRVEKKSTVSAPCRNGPACYFLARGRCNFEHHKSDRHQEGQFRRTNLGKPNQTRGQTGHGRNQQNVRPQCKFQRDCDRVPNCPDIHNTADFPQYQKFQGFRGTNKSGNNRNNRNQYRS